MRDFHRTLLAFAQAEGVTQPSFIKLRGGHMRMAGFVGPRRLPPSIIVAATPSDRNAVLAAKACVRRVVRNLHADIGGHRHG